MHRLMALALIVSGTSVGPTWAAPDCSALLKQGYSCAVPITPGEAVGELTKSAVGVQSAGGGGFTPIHVTTKLNVNDKVTVGSEGMTFITAGPECQGLQLPANSLVRVDRVGECAGVRIDRNPSLAGVGDGSGVVLGIAVIGGGIAAALLVNNQKSVSP